MQRLVSFFDSLPRISSRKTKKNFDENYQRKQKSNGKGEKSFGARIGRRRNTLPEHEDLECIDEAIFRHEMTASWTSAISQTSANNYRYPMSSSIRTNPWIKRCPHHLKVTKS